MYKTNDHHKIIIFYFSLLQSSDEDKDTDDETRRQCTEYVFDNLKSGLEHERPSFDASRYKLKKLK
jgi:hypothetical protein